MPTILITGASGGLGRQTAAELAAMGHRLLLVVRDQVKGRQVARGSRGRFSRRLCRGADLRFG